MALTGFATVPWARAPLRCVYATARGWADLGCGLQEGFEKAGQYGRVHRVRWELWWLHALISAHPAEFPFNHSPMVTRSCSSSCLATDPDGIGVAQPVFCCFRDLCNSGEAGLVPGL